MKIPIYRFIILIWTLFYTAVSAQEYSATNPLIWADVPDMSMIRVDQNYYMSSTTMHMSPGVPIMKSTDLVNWHIVSYAYDTLANIDALNLNAGKNAYGQGSWASSLRFHQGKYYLSTFSQTSGKTYIYTAEDIEKGNWERFSFRPSLHDNSLFFDDSGKIYMVYGAGKIKLVELEADLSGIKPGSEQIIIENASTPAGSNIGLPAEGSQLFKIRDKYYLFTITWPRGGMRTALVHRADKITGPYEGRIAIQDKGVAQGGLINTPEDRWYAYMFRDFGALGRIPYLLPVQWNDDWPILGTNGLVPDTLDLPAGKSLAPGVVASDDFNRNPEEASLPLVWQWNHNPDNTSWSLDERAGFLRLRTRRTDSCFLSAKNTLTQRSIGPVCSGTTAIELSGMKNDDFAGLALLQKKYALLGVKVEQNKRFLVIQINDSGRDVILQKIRPKQKKVWLRAECDFRDRKDIAYFQYSLDGKEWIEIDETLKMEYTLPHFMGYRFGLFNFTSGLPGGYADFDFFHISDQLSNTN